MSERMALLLRDLERRLRNLESGGREVPSVAVKRTADVNLTTGTPYTVSWQAETEDTDEMWASGAPTEIVIKVAGRYEVYAAVQVAASATGDRQAYLNHYAAATGVTTMTAPLLQRAPAGANNPWRAVIAWVLDLAVGDKLSLVVVQDSGGNLALRAVDWAPVMKVMMKD